MSKMVLRGTGKPPLARSPIRLRSRRPALQPTPDNIIRTPPGSLTKSKLRSRYVEKSDIQPQYQTISSEIQALTTMVQQELGTKNVISTDDNTLGCNRSPLFERGRFYDLYSARRNERLREKKAEMEAYEKKHSYSLGVRVESSKKRDTTKLDSRKKTAVAMVAAASAERRNAPTPRYSLRSSTKTAKKPSAVPIMMSVEASERRVGARRTTRKI